MVIIGMSAFPPSSATAVGKKFPNLPALPDFMTRRGPYVLSQVGEGVTSITLYEFDNSRMAEAMTSLGKYYAALRDVPGYTYSFKVYFEAHEALETIGLA
jgi:hypothetical protein